MDALIRGHVTAITLGAAHFVLHVHCADEDFLVSTGADVHCGTSGSERLDFRDAKADVALVGLIGAELQAFIVHDPGRAASLIFDNNRQITAWWPDRAYDNLFLVRSVTSGDWWVVE